jgi:hypothetical protein
MSSVPGKPVIFMSYSHKDEPKELQQGEVRWLSEIQSHLQPAANSAFQLWSDEEMAGGADWESDINGKLAECSVCVPLLSRHSLASKAFANGQKFRFLLDSGPAPSLCLPLHPDLGPLAQCSRGLLLQIEQTPPQTRCLPLDCRSPDRHQPLPEGDQPSIHHADSFVRFYPLDSVYPVRLHVLPRDLEVVLSSKGRGNYVVTPQKMY